MRESLRTRVALAGMCVMNLIGTAGVPAEEIPVMLLGQGGPVWTTRAVPESTAAALAAAPQDTAVAARLHQILRLQLAGPTPEEAAAGMSGLFPEGAALDEVSVSDGHGTVRLTLPAEYLREQMDEVDVENVVHLTTVIGPSTPGLRSLSVEARAPGDARYRRLPEFLPPLPPPVEKPSGDEATGAPGRARPMALGQPPTPGQPQPAGSLSNASIFLSPGHGWYYDTGLGRWATQRGNTNNIIEDLSNGEAVLQFLCQYLWNAGARVYVCRERDMQTNMVIVDNADAIFTGSWTTETLSGTYDGNHRYASTVTGSPTATATFTPNLPAAGNYSVWVWYRTSGAGTTTTDARITVNHSGGSTTWTQNQQRDGFTWKYIGTYHFNAGTGGSVVIDNQSSVAGNRVIADAVRFGGGMGDMFDPNDPAPQSTSGEPRWEESGRYYAGFMGKSDWATYGTVTAMPRYAAWEHESWETYSCYFAWHTNAPNPGTGTETYAYSSAGWNGPFDGVAGGDILRNFIHSELINDIRAGWDAGWVDRGTHTANFGELNPTNNSEMPAALAEIAFHDTPADAQDLLDPNFRRLAARAVYQGIVKFFNSYYGLPGTLLPEPPTNLRVINNGSGGVTLSWNAPPHNTGDGLLGDAATGYRVYRSSDGRGFDNGTTLGNVLTTTISGLNPGEVYYFRVTATNAGGESFPTETLAVRVRSTGGTPVLIVNGFDRIDRFANIVEDDPYSTADLHRGFLWLMNTYDYIIAHAQAVDAYGRDFDSCANEAVAAGQVNLNDYHTVIWILGEESSVDNTFDAAERTAVTNFLTAGGHLFLSGAEIGYELEGLGVAPSFYNSTLRADYLADDGGSYTASGVAGTIFQGIALTFDNGTSIYDVDWPDRIGTSSGSVVCMNYTAPGSGGAALQYPPGLSNGTGQIVMLGFPFETITDASARNSVMARALDFLGTPLPVELSVFTAR